MTPKQPTAIDKFVGERIRLARVNAGLSQLELGRALNITFQQLQKYEKGVNRVSASRLFAIAQLFNLPIGWFFDGIES